MPKQPADRRRAKHTDARYCAWADTKNAGKAQAVTSTDAGRILTPQPSRSVVRSLARSEDSVGLADAVASKFCRPVLGRAYPWHQSGGAFPLSGPSLNSAHAAAASEPNPLGATHCFTERCRWVDRRGPSIAGERMRREGTVIDLMKLTTCRIGPICSAGVLSVVSRPARRSQTAAHLAKCLRQARRPLPEGAPGT